MENLQEENICFIFVVRGRRKSYPHKEKLTSYSQDFTEGIDSLVFHLEAIRRLFMISDAMRLIQVALQDYILEHEPALGPGQIIVIDNIAMAEELGGSSNELAGHVVMSLVNLQEESTLKNASPYGVANGRTIYRTPPISLNLFVLFSALHNQYETSLRLLSRVIEFFQWKTELSFTTTPTTGGLSRDLRIVSDLYSLTFEQLNHLWGALGGKQVPFVLYRFRVVTLEAQEIRAEGEVISEVSINEQGVR